MGSMVSTSKGGGDEREVWGSLWPGRKSQVESRRSKIGQGVQRLWVGKFRVLVLLSLLPIGALILGGCLDPVEEVPELEEGGGALEEAAAASIEGRESFFVGFQLEGESDETPSGGGNREGRSAGPADISHSRARSWEDWLLR